MSKTITEAASPRTDWLDKSTDAPLIGQYAERLGTFLDAMADGRVDAERAGGPGGAQSSP